MTDSEYFTLQFYTWEYRGRGLHQEEYPVQLEPPFIPFIRHLPQRPQIDEGKRHTLISRFIENLDNLRSGGNLGNLRSGGRRSTRL